MVKKILKVLLIGVLVFSLAAPVVTMPALAADDASEIENKADSWRFSDGELNEDADKTIYNENRDGTLQTEVDCIGGCTLAWSKLNGLFYNSKGDVIRGARSKGMDVSRWQKDIDWYKVKNSSDIDFVILRCGYGNNKTAYDDSKFIRNATYCEKLGIPYGVYLYSYADSLSDARSEANHTLRLLEGRKLSYPVYYDLEDKVVQRQGRSNIIKFAKEYCSRIKAEGYQPGIYASLVWFNKYLNDPSLDGYSKWIAQWNYKCTYDKPYRLWQCTSNGSVAGVQGRVDINFDFSNKVKPTPTPSLVRYKTTDNLNYRTGPGTKYSKKGTYKKGTSLYVSRITNDWGLLANGYYVSMKYMKKYSAATTSTTTKSTTKTSSKSKSYKVKTTDYLNYRTGAGTKYKKKGTYKKGKTLTIVSKKNGWGKTSSGYYVYLKYTKKL